MNQLRRHRPPADGERLQELPLRFRQRAETRTEHVGQRRRSIGPGVVEGDISRQLLEEERIPTGFARDSDPVGGAHGRLGRNQRPDQLVGFLVLHRPERKRLAPLGSAAFEQRLEERLRGGFLAAETQQREQRRRPGRREQFLEQDRAVRIGPVQVVDVEDDRMTNGNRRQQFTERRERAAAQHERIGDLVRLRWAGGNRLHLQHHREQPRERQHVARHQRLGLRSRQRAEIVAQTVDDAVEGLVRDRLPLIAPAAQNHEVVGRRQLVEKAPDQRALADSRGAMNVDRRRATLACRQERAVQQRQRQPAADERWVAARLARHPAARTLPRMVGHEPAERIAP